MGEKERSASEKWIEARAPGFHEVASRCQAAQRFGVGAASAIRWHKRSGRTDRSCPSR